MSPLADAEPGVPPAGARAAVVALLLATVFWGCGFTWAKAAGEAVNREAGLAGQSLLGPIFILAFRFGIAGVLLLFVRPARSGWSAAGALRIGGVGVLLALGLVFQHVGLDRTSEAVSAFLTSLTILFVPILSTLALRRPPPPIAWPGVALATVGVWMMTGAATGASFGAGELLGLACAFTFSLYILAVNAASRTEGPWRMSAGQFLATGALCAAACLFVPGGPSSLAPAALRAILSEPAVWTNIVLLTLFPTLIAFGLLNHFQPRLDATRAALIYLIEPVVAAAYAYLATGHGLSPVALAGASLILLANVLVELISARRKRAGARTG